MGTIHNPEPGDVFQIVTNARFLKITEVWSRSVEYVYPPSDLPWEMSRESLAEHCAPAGSVLDMPVDSSGRPLPAWRSWAPT